MIGEIPQSDCRQQVTGANPMKININIPAITRDSFMRFYPLKASKRQSLFSSAKRNYLTGVIRAISREFISAQGRR